ncbi:MAG: GNAT family N-acetyltransferase [Flavobacteriales bacterium]|jgi:putative acetyltransferase|tara:strand:- start:1107 stop:1604 length:498 start_codon:yes stop_codon:yes gene_type:complete
MEANLDYEIREVKLSDNLELESVLSTVMREFNIPEKGTALSDPELKNMFNAYQNKSSIYYVIISDNKILGGAGISKLKNSNKNICELQKMYFLKSARGIGLGKIMIEKCLNDALIFGYEDCYIETMHNMKSAQKLYLFQGFKYIKKPMGNTGHSSCPVWMLRKLQ